MTPEAYALQLAVIRAAVDEGGARFADNIRAALTELERLDLGPRRSIGGSIPDAMRSRHAAGETVESLAWDFGWELADVLAVTRADRESSLAEAIEAEIGIIETRLVGARLQSGRPAEARAEVYADNIDRLRAALARAGAEQPERARCTGCYGCGECVPYPRQDA